MRNEKKRNQRMRMKVCLKKTCDGNQMMICKLYKIELKVLKRFLRENLE